MADQLANESVDVALGAGHFTLRWPAHAVTLGPCRASVALAGEDRAPSPSASWTLHEQPAYGRDGTWARLTGGPGTPSIALHVPRTGPVVVVTTEVEPDAATTLDVITPLAGNLDLEYERRLVDGYDSWAYSGVRGSDAGSSFWNAAYVADDGRALVLQALDARRFCTRIGNDGSTLRVDCGSAPRLDKVDGTWGYLVREQPPVRLPVASGEHVAGEPIAVGAGDDAVMLVEDLAALAGDWMHARHWRGPEPLGWESWYHYGLFVSADDVLTNARALRARYPARFDLVQVDDGWQRTYGAWWPNERFPNDLGVLVRELRALGCRPGLWLAPFRVQPDAPGIATDHPEWLLHERDGRILHETRNNTLALDASHPGALAWLRDLGVQVRAWGFEMVKVDFCYLAALDGTRHDPRVTGIEALDRGLRALADGLGDDVYVLGCGMPVLPAVGVCHANRVGHDLAMPREHQALGHPLDEGWTGFAGVRAQARNVAARWAQAGRWYDADPEVLMAWGSDGQDPAGYSLEEARTIATMVVVTGGPFLLADDLDALRPAERAVLEHPALLDLVSRAPFRPVDVLEITDPDDVVQHAFSQGPGIPSHWCTERAGSTVHALFNWTDAPIRRPVPDGLAGATEMWTGEPVGNTIEVPAHAVRVVHGASRDT